MAIAVSGRVQAHNDPSGAQDAALTDLIRAALPMAERLAWLKEHAARAGQIACPQCLTVGSWADFPLGRGRQHGQHPEHHYCAKCGRNLTYAGWWDGGRGRVWTDR